MRIEINDHLHASPLCMDDVPRCVELLNDEEVSRPLLRVPYPYDRKDAEEFIGNCMEQAEKDGIAYHWAIRENGDGRLIGVLGFEKAERGQSHRMEIGYWLGRPYWSKGVMTDAVRAMCEFAFANYGILRIFAGVYEFNIGSARVLEKCGFKEEGLFERHVHKQGRYFNVRAFGLLKPGAFE